MNHLWMKRLVNLLRLSALIVAFSSSISASANNVILIIGDGMDDNQITIARNYLVGSNGQLLLDQLPMRSAVQVLSVDEDNPKRAIYVADLSLIHI